MRTTLPVANVRSWTRSQIWLHSQRPCPPDWPLAGRWRPASGSAMRPASVTSQISAPAACQMRSMPAPPPWRIELVATSLTASTRSPVRVAGKPAPSARSFTSRRTPASVPEANGSSCAPGGGSGSGRSNGEAIARRSS